MESVVPTINPATGLEHEAQDLLRRKLRAVILLAGSVRPTRLLAAIGRPLLDLPLGPDRSVLDAWRDQVEDLAGTLSVGELPMRVLVNKSAMMPRLPAAKGRVAVTTEQDPWEYRGTGGVLRDAIVSYEDDDLILVAGGPQVLYEPLTALAQAMIQRRADVVVLADREGRAGNIVLLRCGSLRVLPTEGFVDFKEQALPKIAARADVRVIKRERLSSLPVRTLTDYIAVLRRLYRGDAGVATGDPFAEDWRPTFSIVEPDATVHPQARVHDSVVLRGGRVESGAVVVRSIVGPGGVARRDAMEVDRLVAGGTDAQGVKRDRP